MAKHSSQDAAQQQKALIFIHITKAAGTVIRRQFAPEVTFSISGPNVPGSIREFVNLLEAPKGEDPGWLRGTCPTGYIGI